MGERANAGERRCLRNLRRLCVGVGRPLRMPWRLQKLLGDAVNSSTSVFCLCSTLADLILTVEPVDGSRCIC